MGTLLGGCSRRRIQWIAAALGGAITLAVVAAAVKSSQVNTRVERALQELVERGDPVEPGQLVGSPIPDDQNAAVLYEQAFEALDLSDEDHLLLSDAIGRERTLADPDTAACAQDLLLRNGEALRLIHLAAARPGHDFGLDFHEGFQLSLPHCSRLRACARLLALEGVVLAESGRADEAATRCAQVFRVGDAVDDPLLVCQNVRWFIIALGQRALNTALSQCRASSEICLQLAADVGQIDITAGFIDALKGERAMGIDCFDAVRAAPDPMRVIGDMGSEGELNLDDSSEHTGPLTMPRAGPLTRWVLASDEIEYLQLMERAIAIAPRPYRETHDVLADLVPRETGLLPPPPLLTPMITPCLERSFAQRDRAVAHIHLSEVLLLLEGYRDAREAYPESLDDLAAFAGRELPVDPFSGQPFSYRPESTGFMLYSWGPNLIDDGGTPPPPDQYGEGDIVVKWAT